MAIVFFSGFEEGSLSNTVKTGGWDITGTLSVDSTTKKTGGYSLQTTSNSSTSAYVSKTINYKRIKFDVYNSTSTIDAVLANILDCGNGVVVQFGNSDQQDSYYVMEFVGGTGQKILMTQNTWYRVEVVLDSTTLATLYVDGVSASTITPTGTPTQFTSVKLGCTTSLQYYNYHFDDVVLSDATTEIGAVKIIARQGKSGTPTYDGWTKSNTSTIDTVWCNTPYTTATYATSVFDEMESVDLVQTILLSSFGSGTDAITSADTINACKTSVVSYTNSQEEQGENITLWKRLNATDTSYSIVIPSAEFYTDIYRESDIWTSTLTYLNSMQAGCQRAMSGAIGFLNVYDLWVQVAYTQGVGSTFVPQIMFI